MSRRKRRLTQMTAIDQINVTPLLDLVFLLLIAFMLTMPLMEYGTSVNSPEMNAGALPQDKIRINVSLLADGTVECDGRILPRDVLLQQLAARRAELENDNYVVLLRGDADQRFGALVDLWRDLKRLGLTKITLVTQAERAAR